MPGQCLPAGGIALPGVVFVPALVASSLAPRPQALHFISSHDARYSLCGEVARPNFTKPCHRRHNVQHCICSHGRFCHLRTSCWPQMAVSQSALCFAPSIASGYRHNSSHPMQSCTMCTSSRMTRTLALKALDSEESCHSSRLLPDGYLTTQSNILCIWKLRDEIS